MVPHVKDVVDRFAAADFTALAPDLYHGQASTEPDGAGKDLSGAIDLLVSRSGSPRVGVVGYCMGGGLTLVVACQRPDAVAAAAPYYGAIPWEGAQPDYSKLAAKVVGEYAENDGWASPEVARALQSQLQSLGKDAVVHIHPGCEHAFFNDARPEVYNAAASAEAFGRTLELFRAVL